MVREVGVGLRQLADLCEAQGDNIDIFKRACGSMRVQPRELVKQKIALARQFGIGYSTGGVLERVLLQGPDAVTRFIDEAHTLGFSEVEISNGHTILSIDDKQELITAVSAAGLLAVPEVAMCTASTM